MGSHVERRHEIKLAGCRSESLSVDSGDAEEGWSGVELALAFVDQMVGGLADLGDGLPVVDGDITEFDEVFRLDQPMSSSSHQLTDDVALDEDEDVMCAVDDDARRCINDACNIL